MAVVVVELFPARSAHKHQSAKLCGAMEARLPRAQPAAAPNLPVLSTASSQPPRVLRWPWCPRRG